MTDLFSKNGSFLVPRVMSAVDHQYVLFPYRSCFFFLACIQYFWHRNIWLPCCLTECWWIPGMSSMKWPVFPKWEQLLNMHGWKINEAAFRGNVDIRQGHLYDLQVSFTWWFLFWWSSHWDTQVGFTCRCRPLTKWQLFFLCGETAFFSFFVLVFGCVTVVALPADGQRWWDVNDDLSLFSCQTKLEVIAFFKFP